MRKAGSPKRHIVSVQCNPCPCIQQLSDGKRRIPKLVSCIRGWAKLQRNLTLYNCMQPFRILNAVNSMSDPVRLHRKRVHNMGSFAHLSCMDCIGNTIAVGLFEQGRIQQKISCIFIACQIQTEHTVRKKLSDNFYWHATRRGDYTALNTLAPAKLQVRSQLSAAGGRKVIRTTVRNVGRSVAFAVHVQPYRRSDGERTLPYVADDNYFTLLQGESRQIDFEFDAGLLPDDRYTVRAEAYNR